MYCHKLTALAVISVLTQWGQVRSQGDSIVKRVLENGPTGISIEAQELRQRSQGPPGVVVNGPTGYSVEAQQQQQTSQFEEVEEELEDSSDAGKPAFVESDVDLEGLDNDQDISSFVNGHTGSSVHFDQLKAEGGRGRISTNPKENKGKKQLRKGLHVQTTDWSRDAPQWSFKSDEWTLVSLPDKENHPTLPAPLVPSPALVVATKEPLKKVEASRIVEGLENVTLHYSYYLSEGEPPHGTPELMVYQVKDDHSSQMVSSASTHGAWSDSSVDLPYSGSSKIVFVGQLKKLGNEIAIDDITISGISTGPAENITISSSSTGPAEKTIVKKEFEKKAKVTGEVRKLSTTEKLPEVSTEAKGVTGVTEGQRDEEGTVTPGEVVEGTGSPQETGEGTEKTQEVAEEVTRKTQETFGGTGITEAPENGTDITDEAAKGTENPEETELTTINSNVTVQGNDTSDMVEGIGIPEQGNETYSTDVAESTDNPEQVNETVISENSQGSFQANVTLALTEAPQSTVAQVQETATGIELNATEFVNDNMTMTSVPNGYSDNATEVPQVNQTALANITTDVELTGDGNNTEILVTSALPPNMTGNVDHNVTNNFTNGPVDTTVNPGIVITRPSVLNNQTGSVATISHANLTEAPINNATGGGNITSNLYLTTAETTPDVSNPPSVNATSGQGNTDMGSTTTSLIMTNSTSPSGSNGTSLGIGPGLGNGTDATGGGGGDDNSSWSAFKVFLIICLLGVVVMGFLYWRRQRRRDDEIPVFSRAPHADYHNPTFSDDDSNFASRGTGHNYKSFE